MKRLWNWLVANSQWVLNSRGGGKDPEVIKVDKPEVKAPDPLSVARAQTQAQLETNPQLAQQYYQLQQQYSPLLSALQQQTRAQILPQEQQLQQQLYPLQSQISETLAGGALQRLQDPGFMQPGELAAQQASREQAIRRLQEAMRTRANLGGGLYGGRSARAETESVSDLLRAFEEQDYLRRQQAQQAAVSQALPLVQQLMGQQIQQLPIGIQGATMSPESIAQGQLQAALASQPEMIYQQGTPSPIPGLIGTLGGAFLGPMGASLGGSLGNAIANR